LRQRAISRKKPTMQISKSLLILGAVAFCAGTVLQAAPDSEAQAKAREALRKKIAELEAQPVSEVPATPAPAPPPVAQPKPSPAPKSAAQPRPPKPAPTPEAAPVVRQPVPESASGSKAQVFADPTPPAGNPRATPEQIERSRESVRQKIAELNEQDKATVGAPTAIVSQPRPKARPAPVATVFDPIPAPPSTFSASQQARLAELLKEYQADALTPEQYHKERAKILAEP
jgi:hypothetical protein